MYQLLCHLLHCGLQRFPPLYSTVQSVLIYVPPSVEQTPLGKRISSPIYSSQIYFGSLEDLPDGIWATMAEGSK